MKRSDSIGSSRIPRAARQSARGAVNRNLVLTGVAVLGLALAVVITLRFGRDEPAPTNMETSGTPWVCAACKTDFMLSGADTERLRKTGKLVGGRGGDLTAECPKCHELKAMRAKICKACGKPTPSASGDGSPTKCIHCGKNPYAAP